MTEVLLELFDCFFEGEPDFGRHFVRSIDKDDVHDGECFESYFLEIEDVAFVLLCLLFGKSGVDKLNDIVQLYVNSFHRTYF